MSDGPLYALADTLGAVEPSYGIAARVGLAIGQKLRNYIDKKTGFYSKPGIGSALAYRPFSIVYRNSGLALPSRPGIRGAYAPRNNMYRRRKYPSRRRFRRRPRRRPRKFRRLRMRYRFKRRYSRRNPKVTKHPTKITRKWIDSGQIGTTIGKTNQATFNSMTAADLALLGAYMQYLDPVTGLVAFNALAVSTYDLRLMVRYHYSIAFKNNGQSPLRMIVSKYKCVSACQSGHDREGEHAAWMDGQTQLYGSALGTKVTDPDIPALSIAASDSYASTKWAPAGRKTVSLDAGQTYFCKLTSPWFEYSTQEQDDHAADLWRPALLSQCFVVEVHGGMGHDTVTGGEVSYLQALVDYVMYKTISVRYDGGLERSLYLYGGNSSSFVTSAFTTAGVSSSKPVADNIGFSRS